MKYSKLNYCFCDNTYYVGLLHLKNYKQKQSQIRPYLKIVRIN